MYEYKPLMPKFDYYSGLQVIVDDKCLQSWQLNDFTKELMGPEWVKKFNAWAEHSLPKQPACYMLGKDKMIVHPSIAQAIRDKVYEQSQFNWRTTYPCVALRSPSSMFGDCSA